MNNSVFYIDDVTLSLGNHFVFEKYGINQKCSFISTNDGGSIFVVRPSAKGLIMDFSNHNITLISAKMDTSSSGSGGIFYVCAENATLIGGEYVNCLNKVR